MDARCNLSFSLNYWRGPLRWPMTPSGTRLSLSQNVVAVEEMTVRVEGRRFETTIWSEGALPEEGWHNGPVRSRSPRQMASHMQARFRIAW